MLYACVCVYVYSVLAISWRQFFSAFVCIFTSLLYLRLTVRACARIRFEINTLTFTERASIIYI